MLAPVSYTHLDVYKRQALFLPAGHVGAALLDVSVIACLLYTSFSHSCYLSRQCLSSAASRSRRWRNGRNAAAADFPVF